MTADLAGTRASRAERPGSARPDHGGFGPAVWRAAVALLALQLVVRGWISLRGFFYLDDFVFTGRAMEYGPFDARYLFTAYNSHVMPGGFLWAWLTTRLFAYSYPAVVIGCLALQLAVGWAFFVLLRRLFGARPLILVPFAAFLLSPITLPGSLWWAAAMSQLPQLLAMAAILLCHLRYLRSGRFRAGLAGPLVLAAGLLFSEKTLLALPLLAVLHVGYFAGGPFLGRLRTAFSGHWRVWAGYAAVALPYLVYYAVAVPSPARRPADGSSIVQLVQESFVRAVIPGILGGPWRWSQIGYAGALADPSPFACALALAAAAAVVVGTCVVFRRAWFAWAGALGYCLLDLALVALSRGTFIGPVIADEYRYVTDTALIIALALAFALMPVAGSWPAAQPQRLERRVLGWRWLASPELAELKRSLPKVSTGPAVALTVGALAASSLYSTAGYDQFWRINPARAYLTNARADLADAPEGVVLADTFVPARVAWPLLGRYARTPQILSPLPHAPAGLGVGSAAAALYVVTETGHLERAVVPGLRAAHGPVADCGWRARVGAPADITLPRTTLPWDWTVRVGYVSDATGPARVTVGNRTTPVTVRAGAGQFFVSATGRFDRIRLEVLAGPGGASADMCTDDVTVGVPVPAGGSRR
jgi:hypothetical protein